MVPSDVKILGTLKAFKFAIKRWLPETASVHSKNGMSTKLAFYEFRMYFVFTLAIFPLSHSFHINRIVDVE